MFWFWKLVPARQVDDFDKSWQFREKIRRKIQIEAEGMSVEIKRLLTRPSPIASSWEGKQNMHAPLWPNCKLCPAISALVRSLCICDVISSRDKREFMRFVGGMWRQAIRRRGMGRASEFSHKEASDTTGGVVSSVIAGFCCAGGSLVSLVNDLDFCPFN